jgi:hypothetical protein
VHCDTSEQVDVAKTSLKETGAKDISSTGEAGSKDTAGGRETFGSILEPSAVSARAQGEIVDVNRDEVLEPTTIRKF